MKVVVLGLWHLGSVTAACLAAAGIQTVGVDDDTQTVADLRLGKPPLFEPRLAETVALSLGAGTLTFTTDNSALADADVVWVCHDTPVDEEDRADVEHVMRKLVGTFDYLRDGAVVLVSAQLPVGTVARAERAFAAQARGRTVSFACSPENLRLGRAIEIFRNPGRIIIGVRDGRAREVLSPLLGKFCTSLIWMSVESAEMVKHALNAFLAVSIAFTNELAIICERVGAEARDVEMGLRSEPRIGQHAYVRPGPAFGGGTLARDIQFLSTMAHDNGLRTPLIGSVIESNKAHRDWTMDQLRRLLGPLAGQRIAVLGLAYKAGTDAIRRSPAIDLVRSLVAAGAAVLAFDPEVRSLPPEFDRVVTLAVDARSALSTATAVVIATEWPEFRQLTAMEMARAMSGNLVVDPGRYLGAEFAADTRLTVVSIGKAS